MLNGMFRLFRKTFLEHDVLILEGHNGINVSPVCAQKKEYL